MMEMRTHIRIDIKGEYRKMIDNKVELLKLILESVNLEQAVLTAATIISDLLKQHESDQEQVAVCLPVVSQMNTPF